ncbi:MAG TPA: DUF3822 family protein [Bacteroidales bacterium]|nr:DUF3822 family protein [Bacteroidales bacterium]
MKNVSIKDFDSNNYDSSKLNLSILLTQNGLSFSLKLVEENKFIALHSYKFQNKRKILDETEKYLKKENLLGKVFNSILVVISDSRQTIVPDVLFSPGSENNIWELNFEPDESCEVLYSHLEKSENYVVFPINRSLNDKIKALFPDCKLYPSSHTFIESHFTQNILDENQTNAKIFVQVFDDYFELLVLNKAGIKLFNVFSYTTSNDILYFLINVFDKLKLSQSETELVLSGFIDSDNSAIINLKKFVSQVYFESQNTDYNYFYRFQEIAPHYFYNFLNF